MPHKKVVVFTSPTCGPCKRLKPELAKFAQEREFELEIVELSDETRPRFVSHGIRNVPVTALITDDVETDRFTGQLPTSQLEARLDEWGL